MYDELVVPFGPVPATNRGRAGTTVPIFRRVVGVDERKILSSTRMWVGCLFDSRDAMVDGLDWDVIYDSEMVKARLTEFGW